MSDEYHVVERVELLHKGARVNTARWNVMCVILGGNEKRLRAKQMHLICVCLSQSATS